MKRLVLFSFILLFSSNSFAQLSFDVGYDYVGVNIDTDFNGFGGCSYQAVRGGGIALSFKTGWHYAINDFLELDVGFSFSANRYWFVFHNPPCRAESEGFVPFKRLESPIIINGLIPISNKGIGVISAGLTPQFNLKNENGKNIYFLPSSNSSWKLAYEIGTGYRYQAAEKHQLEIGFRYKKTLNYFVIKEETLYGNYSARFKQYNLGLQVGYIYNFK